MVKIKLDRIFKNLKGEEIKNGENPLRLGEVLSEIIIAPHKDKDGFRPLKAIELSRKLYNDKEIMLDKADFIQLKEIVDKNVSYVPLITGQILEFLEEVKNEDK